MYTKYGIHELWKKGKSIVIPFASYESKQLVDVLFEFEKYFKRGQVNIYASPKAGSKSFPAHGDQTENCVNQAYQIDGPAFISLKSDPQLTKSITT